MEPTAATRSSAPGALDLLETRRLALPVEHAQVVAKANGSAGPSWRFVISAEAEDLVGDVVVQSGLTPVGPRIPAQVDHSGQVRDLIGWWDNITTEGRRTFADLRLFEPGLSQIADFVRALLDAGVRMAASIGFVPVRDAYELIRDTQNDRVTGFRFLKSTLIETSVVVVPAQPLALNVAKSFGLNADRFDRFVMSAASQQLLRTMPARDALARSAAALQTANRLLKGGSS